MAETECYICHKVIQFDLPYYSMERLLQKKSDGACGNDEIQEVPMPCAVLITCDRCIDNISTDDLDSDLMPFGLIGLEKNRLRECYKELLENREDIPIAISCSVCDRDIEVGSKYIRIHLSLEVAHKYGVEPLRVTTIGLLCNECSHSARELMSSS